MPTPLTEKAVRRVVFTEPEASTPKRQRTDGGYAAIASPATPSSVPPQPPTPGSGVINETKMVREIMDLLKGQNIKDSVLLEVQETARRHAAIAKGLELGRDASRKARDIISDYTAEAGTAARGIRHLCPYDARNHAPRRPHGGSPRECADISGHHFRLPQICAAARKGPWDLGFV
ncbi:hypothetical protein GGR56DRAFT_626425 [Xylariaceae sp. FL0804]|nr:hypothetical protein GGR56DRAFT_626425 [Xylariaceae sp. FL0804]